MAAGSPMSLPLILGIALLGVCVAPAQAALVDVTVTGVVTAVGTTVDPPAGPFLVGQAMSATFTYDSDTPGPAVLGDSKTYNGAVIGGTYAIGAYGGSALTGRITISDDDASLNDRFRLQAGGLSSPVIPPDHSPFNFDIALEDVSQVVFDSLALPLALDLADFTARTWRLQFTPIPLLGVESNSFVEGTLSTLEVTVREGPPRVPGPSALDLLLLASGGALPLGARRHRRAARAR